MRVGPCAFAGHIRVAYGDCWGADLSDRVAWVGTDRDDCAADYGAKARRDGCAEHEFYLSGFVRGERIDAKGFYYGALLFFGAILFDRAALSLRSLAIAMILVVPLAPWSVLTPGFQMSFAATGALIMTYEVCQRRRRAEGRGLNDGSSSWTKSVVVTSLVTSLATVPFALFHFVRMAPMGLIAKVFAMPIVSLVSEPLAGVALVAAPFGLADWPLRAFGWSLDWILWIGEVFSDPESKSGSVGEPMPDMALVVLGLALVLGIIASRWRARSVLGGGLIGLGCLIWWGSSAPVVHWAPSSEVFLIGGEAGAQRFSFVKGEGLAPLRYADTPVLPPCNGPLCVLNHRGLKIALVSKEVGPDCHALEPIDLVLSELDETSICGRPTVSFQTALAQNGLTYRRAGDGLKLISKPDCRARPWRTCPDVD